MDSMRSFTLDATASTSRGSPATRSVYGRLRIVTRTDCLSSMRPVPSRQRLRCAQLIDLSQELFDAAANLLALALESLYFLRETRDIGLQVRGFIQCCLLLLAQARHQLDRTLDAFFERAQRILFLFRGAHSLLFLQGRPRRFLDRQRRFRQLRQIAERAFVVQGDLRQDLAIQVHARGLQAVHELAVGNAGCPAGCIDTDDPQRAIVALLVLASDIGELQSALDRFLRRAMQLTLGKKITGSEG